MTTTEQRQAAIRTAAQAQLPSCLWTAISPVEALRVDEGETPGWWVPVDYDGGGSSMRGVRAVLRRDGCKRVHGLVDPADLATEETWAGGDRSAVLCWDGGQVWVFVEEA